MEVETLVAYCRRCGKAHFLQVYTEDYDRWERKEVLIQDAMPYLNAGERELLISGTCDSCWKEMFGEEE